MNTKQLIIHTNKIQINAPQLALFDSAVTTGSPEVRSDQPNHLFESEHKMVNLATNKLRTTQWTCTDGGFKRKFLSEHTENEAQK